MIDKRVALFSILANLTKEQFDEAVAIFEREYRKNEVVSVNGPWDGGSDLKRFKNGKEQLVCVQVTISKSHLRKKLYGILLIAAVVAISCS